MSNGDSTVFWSMQSNQTRRRKPGVRPGGHSDTIKPTDQDPELSPDSQIPETPHFNPAAEGMQALKMTDTKELGCNSALIHADPYPPAFGLNHCQ